MSDRTRSTSSSAFHWGHGVGAWTRVPLVPQAASSADERGIESMMLDFLCNGLRIPSVSGEEGPFVEFVADWAAKQGFVVDLWQADEASLGGEAASFTRHIPLSGRPTLVVQLPGEQTLPSLMFNAHSDVVPAVEKAWTHGPWSGKLEGDLKNGRVFGRGACDVKGPLASALWALVRLAQQPARRGAALLELVPGEEDCVGLGTLTSVARGWHADAAVVLEPTDELPRCASRGGCRFEIEIAGRAIHGTMKWLGRDAIAAMGIVQTVLLELEADLNHLGDRDRLFADYPMQRPITVDSIRGGQWQGMVCDRCVCAGYFELLPNDDLKAWQSRFVAAVASRLQSRGISVDDVRIHFSEAYRGHRLEPTHLLCRQAEVAVRANQSNVPFAWSAFNSGCEAGLRANRTQTPTLIWGPGSLAQAHTIDEFVDWAAVRRVADMFTTVAASWTTAQQ